MINTDIPTMYRVVNHLDAPKRWLTLTLDEVVLALLGLMLIVVSNQKLVVGVLGFIFYGVLKQAKQGRGPRFLLVLAYWHLPTYITRWFLMHVPASHVRVWKA